VRDEKQFREDLIDKELHMEAVERVNRNERKYYTIQEATEILGISEDNT
jgi:hypothetical protein